MKNFTTTIIRGDLRPKERVLLFVHNQIAKEKTGKEILSEADLHALIESWRPDNNHQVHEYNRYNDAWKSALFSDIDAQMTYLTAVNGYLRASKLVDYVLFENRYNKNKTAFKNKIANTASRILKEVDENKTLDLVLEWLGLDLDYTIYLLAFEMAGEDLQKDLLALYPDAKTEKSYLEQEEVIFDLFGGKNELTKEGKEKLAGLIADEAYPKYFKEWKFEGYFAELPLFELLGKWAFYYKQVPENAEDLLKHLEKPDGDYKDEGEEVGDLSNSIKKVLTPKLMDYTKEHNIPVKEMVKETVLKWLDDGLFIKDFPPMFNSDGKATCNKQDTQLTHKEVFKKWLEAKAKAKEIVQGLIDEGELKTEQRQRSFENFKRFTKETTTGDKEQPADKPARESKIIITGESLYNLKSDFTFAKDFKQQADDFKIFGSLVLFLRDGDFIKEYAKLLAYEELFKRLSKTFEIDLTYKMKRRIDSLKENLNGLSLMLFTIADDIQEAGYQVDRVYYLSDYFIDDMLALPFDPADLKPDTEELNLYYKKFKELLEDDF